MNVIDILNFDLSANVLIAALTYVPMGYNGEMKRVFIGAGKGWTVPSTEHEDSSC